MSGSMIKRQNQYEERNNNRNEFKKKNNENSVKDCMKFEYNENYAPVNSQHSNLQQSEPKRKGDRQMPIKSESVSITSAEPISLSQMNETDMTSMRNQEEIRDLMQAVGVKLRLAQFQNVWQRALEIENSKTKNFRKLVSMNRMMEAMKELRVAY